MLGWRLKPGPGLPRGRSGGGNMTNDSSDRMPDDADANELRLFVAETLAAVMAGVNDVRTTASIASPKGNGYYSFKAPNSVEFDIAVAAKRSGKAGGGLKLEVFSVGLGAKGEKSSETSTVSRVKFSIPRVYLQNGREE